MQPQTNWSTLYSLILEWQGCQSILLLGRKIKMMADSPIIISCFALFSIWLLSMQGISRTFEECLSQQRIQILSNASTCLVHNIRISNTLTSIDTFSFKKLNILHICYSIYLVTLHSQLKSVVESSFIHYKLITLCFLMIKRKSNIKHTLR